VQVNFQFNEEGTRIWYNMTAEAAKQGHKAIAISLNKKVIYSPLIDVAIDGGDCMIVMRRSPGNNVIEDANFLAVLLSDGSLPLEVVLKSGQFK
jgi:preprotein translocase subunit SecD